MNNNDADFGRSANPTLNPLKKAPMSLYRCWSTIAELHGIHGLHMTWFRTDRTAPVGDYADLIADYGPNDSSDAEYARQYVDELFTASELDSFSHWLRRARGTELIVEAIQCPVCMANTFPVGALAVGGDDGFLMLSESKDYGLPFNVWGYFDWRISRTYDERLESHKRSA